MGYRSDVRSIIYGPTDAIVAFWTKHKLLKNAAITAFREDIKVYETLREMYVKGTTDRELAQTSFIDMIADSVKWYDGYEFVDGWEALLRDIDGESPGTEYLSYEFVRIGEETTDIEYKSGGSDVDWLLGIQRNIISDIPNSKKELFNEQDAESQG